jgi:hypothetical protein
MIFNLKNLMLVGLVVVVGWVGWMVHGYFFDNMMPELTVIGLQDDAAYAGDIQCMISSNKAGDIAIWLDEQPLITKFRIHRKNQNNPFTIPTKTITNGKHSLRAELIDATFRHNKAVITRDFNVDNVPLQAAFIKSESDMKVLQGRTLHVQFQLNKAVESAQIHALANMYNCFPESKNSLIYECFIPISCEEKPSEYLLSVDLADRVGNKLHLDNKFQVVLYPFKKQMLQVSAEKMKEEEDHGANSKRFEDLLEEITKNSSTQKLWHGAFCTPIDIDRITCEFGTIRTTKHKGRYAHKAIDVISAPRSVVWAPQDGVIALKERFEVSGNTVVIDHGCGVISLFFHLDDFAKINVGDKITKGSPLGTLGKTGYATGYHLHWEQRIYNIAVDPMQWTRSTF